MKLSSTLTALLATAAFAYVSQSAAADSATTHVRLKTSMGVILIELDAQRAPLTVKNFLQYVRDKHYDNTIFHRVIPGFVIQGGGFSDKNVEKPTRSPVPNEAGNGLSNRRGTVALARTNDPHTGTAQFYINIGENVALDPQPSRWGYAVFGRVIEGIEVAQKISETPTGGEDKPVKPVLIEKMEIVE